MSKKPKQVPKRKRPKSVMAKAWETRRKNALHRAAPEQAMNNLLFGDANAKMPPPNPKPATAGKGKSTRRSSAEIVGNTLGWIPEDRSKPMFDPIGIQVEQILQAASSNNRSKARPEVRHKLFEMVHEAEYKGVESGMAEVRAKQDRDLLCSFVASFNVVDRQMGSHMAPHICSPITLRAIVRFLESHGYMASGKVSMDEVAEKASHINAIR